MLKRTPRQQMDRLLRKSGTTRAEFDTELEIGFRSARLIDEAARELGLNLSLVDGSVTVTGGHVPGRLQKHLDEWDDHLILYLLNGRESPVVLLMDESKLGFVAGQPFSERAG